MLCAHCSAQALEHSSGYSYNVDGSVLQSVCILVHVAVIDEPERHRCAVKLLPRLLKREYRTMHQSIRIVSASPVTDASTCVAKFSLTPGSAGHIYTEQISCRALVLVG